MDVNWLFLRGRLQAVADKKKSTFLQGVLSIHQATAAGEDGLRSAVMPHPDLQAKIQKELAALRRKGSRLLRPLLRAKQSAPVGLNDGLIFPGSVFPVGTPPAVIRSAAANRAPLRGDVRLLVVLVEFPDQPMVRPKAEFEELFFSSGTRPLGSLRDYYQEVSHGQVNMVGQVVGPYVVSKPMVYYANGTSGMGSELPNARTMAKEAVELLGDGFDLTEYDNDGNGFVDAFIVVHAGDSFEATGDPDHLWSHKWVLSGGPHQVGGTKIYSYLTVGEDARIGVCAHELGHLLFGWIDFYDTDYTSSGLGNWCLMSGGSWNNAGDTPAHPSAYCKMDQGWVDVVHVDRAQDAVIEDVKRDHKVYTLWPGGKSGKEYFLLENRLKRGFDAHLPGEGLLIYHVDESIESNSDENHPRVALKQADGVLDLERGRNRGDGSDTFPGVAGKELFSGETTPSSKAYNGVDSGVAVRQIALEGEAIKVHLEVGQQDKPPVVHSIKKRPKKVSQESSDATLAGLETRLRALEVKFLEMESGMGREVRPVGLGFGGDRL